MQVSNVLTSASMLRTMFEEQMDYFKILVPFAAESILKNLEQELNPKSLQALMLYDHGIRLSLNNCSALIDKLLSKGALIDLYGKLDVDVDKMSESTQLEKLRQAAANAEKILNEKFESFKIANEYPIEESFISLFTDFLIKRHGFVIEYCASKDILPLDEASLEEAQELVVAKFINDEILSDEALKDLIIQQIQGYSISNAYTIDGYEDSFKADYSNTTVYLDTGIILSTLGFHGEAFKVAVDELLNELRENNCRIACFYQTVDEISSILQVYHTLIGSFDGKQQLRNTEMKRTFIKKKFGPVDIQRIMNDIEDLITNEDVTIEERPHRVKKICVRRSQTGRRVSIISQQW